MQSSSDHATLERTTVQLGFERPYAWEETLAYYRDRAVAGVESVDGAYTRSIRVGGSIGLVSILRDEHRDVLRAELALPHASDARPVARQLRELLDLDAPPAAIASHLSRDPLLQPIVAAFPGLRIPGCWDSFECAVRAVVGQQVSVKAARTVLGRLVAAHGETLASERRPQLPSRVFPTPAALADRNLTGIGLNTARATTLAAIARCFADDPAFLRPGMPREEAYETLLGIRGIGPWTANYVLLRGLRDLDAFPAADLGALKASGARSAKELDRWAERWRPWRGYALLYLWKSLGMAHRPRGSEPSRRQ